VVPRSGSADVDQPPDPQALPAQAAVDRVYATLRKGILDGTYVQGTRLGEVDLADSLGVSRTPVREALRRLGSEGLLSRRRRCPWRPGRPRT
jgi:DNA-binding GntR family transcriptional regulator